MMSIREKLQPKFGGLSKTLSRVCQRVIPPEHFIEYADEEWEKSVSIFGSGEAIGLNTQPVDASIGHWAFVSDSLYAPETNGTWLSYEDRPHPMEEAEPADIADVGTLNIRPLVFEHFFHSAAEQSDDGDWDARDLRLRFRLYAASALMLKHSRPLEESAAVARFLGYYQDIKRSQAWHLQPTFLGVHLPFKCWPFCIWIDRVGSGQHNRLFSQALTYEGFPLGAAQSWPVNSWGWNLAELDMLNDEHKGSNT